MKQDISDKHREIGKIVVKIRKEKGISQLELSLLLEHKSVSIVADAKRHYRGAHILI
ncbi:XRE family transcriptional regulator [Campylobacter armoricus]|uniref:Uncharacterized protein n=1 Tax=Campylobacter armoricus TaxID=2505970 RepID=A0A7L5HZ98_9BACT|nr:XRE family transcriptional regulator [Campylobacter armoricus]QKF80286.1 hypothetical protein CARM_1393 [Campylobacter armoricus]